MAIYDGASGDGTEIQLPIKPLFKPGDKVIFIKEIMDKKNFVPDFEDDLQKHNIYNTIFTVKECNADDVKLNEMNENYGWEVEWRSEIDALELAPSYKKFIKLRGLYEK